LSSEALGAAGRGAAVTCTRRLGDERLSTLRAWLPRGRFRSPTFIYRTVPCRYNWVSLKHSNNSHLVLSVLKVSITDHQVIPVGCRVFPCRPSSLIASILFHEDLCLTSHDLGHLCGKLRMDTARPSLSLLEHEIHDFKSTHSRRSSSTNANSDIYLPLFPPDVLAMSFTFSDFFFRLIECNIQRRMRPALQIVRALLLSYCSGRHSQIFHPLYAPPIPGQLIYSRPILLPARLLLECWTLYILGHSKRIS